MRYKITTLGPINVGKTSLIKQLAYGIMDEKGPTIGMEMHIMLGNGNQYQFFDTSGQEKYASLSKVYYESSDLVLIVFDVNSVETLNVAKTWLSETADYQRILIGNKADGQLGENTIKLLGEVAQYNNVPFLLTSCQRKETIEALKELIMVLLNGQQNEKSLLETVVLQDENEKVEDRKCC